MPYVEHLGIILYQINHTLLLGKNPPTSRHHPSVRILEIWKLYTQGILVACVTVEHQREQGPTKTLGYMLYIGDYTTGLVRYRDYDRKLIGIPMNQPVSWDVKRVLNILNGTQLVIIHHHHVPHGCVSTINPLCFWWFDFFYGTISGGVYYGIYTLLRN